ncbi:hypothetical protein MBLNU230_g0755t2 [Neophaeotheca triangularis]
MFKEKQGSSHIAERSPTPDGANRERLPNLFEVLSRRTYSPVDLFSFYIYMRDVQRSVDYLDFWLDVSQHMSLCRHYVRELRRSVLLSTPELEKGGSKRSSQILDNYNTNTTDMYDMYDSTEQGPSGVNAGGDNLSAKNPFSDSPKQQTPEHRPHRGSDARLSAFLRNDDASASKHSPQNSKASNRSSSQASRPGAGKNSFEAAAPRPSFMSHSGNGSSPFNNSSHQESPQHTVARQDIRASAEKILYTYLLPGAEREIILPQGVLNDITKAIEQEGRDDPEVFDRAKDYVFQAMERDAFPGFLRAKALGNLVQPSVSSHLAVVNSYTAGEAPPRLFSAEWVKLTFHDSKMMLRLIVGLVALFGGFWTGFILIFLDRSRAIRCTVILPFTVGLYLLLSHQYMLDPLMALIGYSEYTFMRFNRIKEPFVRKLLNRRALMCLAWIIVIDAALCCLFIFVPGLRL